MKWVFQVFPLPLESSVRQVRDLRLSQKKICCFFSEFRFVYLI